MIRRTDFSTHASSAMPVTPDLTDARRPTRATPREKQTVATTPIRVDHAYSLEDFMRRTGLGRNGLRTAKRKGLSIRQCGRNRYVLGADWHEFLRQHPVVDE